MICKTSLADEERLVVLHGPGHVSFVGVRQAVGILADDDVCLLQTKNSLGFDAEGADAVLLARKFNSSPNVERLVRRDMDFAAPFADEADAEEAGGRSGDGSFTDRHVGECSGGEVEVAKPCENLLGFRSRQLIPPREPVALARTTCSPQIWAHLCISR